jgi:hypothetical protein
MTKSYADINKEMSPIGTASQLDTHSTSPMPVWNDPAPDAASGAEFAGTDHLHAVSTSIIQRTLASVGMLGIALIHALDLPGKLKETPYLGVGYLGLIATSLALAWVLARTGDTRVWLATCGTAAATLAGFSVDRIWGLPGATEDIGNWLEPLGLASLCVEGYVVALSVSALRRLSRAGASRPGR